MYFFFVTMVVCSAKKSVDEGIEETSLPLKGDAFYGVEVIIVSFLGIILPITYHLQERRK